MFQLTHTEAKDIALKVTNVDIKRPGKIMAMVFAEQGFPINHEQALEVQTKPAEKEEIAFTFSISQPVFAIKILHDEDGSGKTTKNWTGIIPAEGLGFSNGAKLTWRGVPKFKQSALLAAEINGPVAIDMIYP